MEVPMGSWACPEEAVPEPMPKAECALVPPTIPPVPAMVPAAIPQAPIEDIPEYRELWPVIWDQVELLMALPGQMEVQFIKTDWTALVQASDFYPFMVQAQTSLAVCNQHKIFAVLSI